jgi:two-component system OmpR family response regulator
MKACRRAVLAGYPGEVPCEIGLVEDDEVIRENLRDFLALRGFSISAFPDRETALAGFSKRLPDVAVLDVCLGAEREGGFALCTQLRALSETLPIVFLTSHDGEIDHVSGLRIGADDYLSKERSFEFLVVRIETLLARWRALEGASGSDEQRDFGRLSLDEAKSRVWWRGRICL